MRDSNKLVYGIGVKSNLYRTVENGKNCHAYSLWSNMLLRCTQKYWSKHPTYTGVACSENFKDHTFFMSGVENRQVSEMWGRMV